jgi:hypothetical protein
MSPCPSINPELYVTRTLIGILMVGCCALAGCGPTPPPTAHGKPVAYWVEQIHSGDDKTRLQAVKALANVGAKDPTVVPALTDAVRDKKEQVRVEAILALLRIGPDAADAVPALTEASRDRNTKVREAAARALERIQGP